MTTNENADPIESICNAIEGAEEVVDPFDGLVDKAKEDPRAPFEPEALEHLAKLRSEDPPAFETLRTQLNRAGIRVTALDEAIAQHSGDTGDRRRSQSNVLLELTEAAELFHAPDSKGYADVEVDDHRETWPIRSKGFRRWLTHRYFLETGGAPSSETMQAALNVIEARAQFDAPERDVHLRVAGHGDFLYLDLADDRWRAVQIGSDGWRIVDRPPVRFRRAAGMLPLPTPRRGGSITLLHRFLNLRSDDDFVLAVTWALAALRDRGPYPVLMLAGEQGSAKSTFAAILRALLDPNSAPLRALPREDRDLFIAATNGHVLAFDNVSGLPPWISDTLCRLATGGGFAVRQLHTDQDEVLFDATRPAILNGIEDVVSRPDLADRAIFLTLEPIPEDRRRPERELWADFEAERPLILGALLDAIGQGLRNLPSTTLERLPRMADFALWATACESGLWKAGRFMAAYGENRMQAIDTVVDADPLASAARSFMATRTVWTGTASDLLGALGEVAGDAVRKAKTWPATPRSLSGRLRRAATFLRKLGIEIAFTKEGQTRTRTITISATPEEAGTPPFVPSVPSAPEASCGTPADGRRTVGPGADARDPATDGRGAASVRDKPLESLATDGADGVDAKSPPQSGLDRSTHWRARL